MKNKGKRRKAHGARKDLFEDQTSVSREPRGLSRVGAIMPYYPIFVQLAGLKVLVVGGGNVAQRKIESLLDHDAEVHVVARDMTPKLKQYVNAGKLTHLGEEFQKEQLDGAMLVIAATDDSGLNRIVSNCAREKGVLINAVDQPADCTFIVPSVLRRGDLQIAISTSGKSPALARKVREDLEKHFGKEYETLLSLMGNLRKEILSRGLSQEENKGMFESLVDSDIVRMIMDSDYDGVASLISSVLDRPVSRGEVLTYFLKKE